MTPLQNLKEIITHSEILSEQTKIIIRAFIEEREPEEKEMVLKSWWAGHDTRDMSPAIHTTETSAEDYYNKNYQP